MMKENIFVELLKEIVLKVRIEREIRNKDYS